MIYLLDTQILRWSVFESHLLSSQAKGLLENESNDVIFSTVSIWEVSIKVSKRPDRFTAHPAVLHSALVDLRYRELSLTSEHAIITATLPLRHRDPFDRILVAQAIVEDTPLVTADRQPTQYPAPILYVG